MGGWSTGLFDFSSDSTNSIVSCLFPWISIVQNRAELQNREPDPADLCWTCLSNPWSQIFNTRQEIRSKYDIPRDIHGDCVGVICCCWCMTSQHHREIHARGDNAVSYSQNDSIENRPLLH